MNRSLKLLGVAAAIAIPCLTSTEASAQPYGPPPPPGYAQYNPWQWHRGLTFEGNIGVGFMWARASSNDSNVSSTSDTKVGFGGLNLGLGGWLNPQLALSIRVAGVTYTEDLGDNFSASLTGAFFGPSVQYWIDPHLWIGGGAGLAIARVISHDDIENVSFDEDNQTGFGLDLRAGYSFSSGATPNSWNISVEYTPGFFGSRSDDVTVQLNGFAILFGYQYL